MYYMPYCKKSKPLFLISAMLFAGMVSASDEQDGATKYPPGFDGIAMMCAAQNPVYLSEPAVQNALAMDPVMSFSEFHRLQKRFAECEQLNPKATKLPADLCELTTKATFDIFQSNDSEPLIAQMQAAVKKSQQVVNNAQNCNLGGDRDYTKPLYVYAPAVREQIFAQYKKNVPALLKRHRFNDASKEPLESFLVQIPNVRTGENQVWAGYKFCDGAVVNIAYERGGYYGYQLTTEQFGALFSTILNWQEGAHLAFPAALDPGAPSREWLEGFVGLLSVRTPQVSKDFRLRGWEAYVELSGRKESKLQKMYHDIRGFDDNGRPTR